MTDPEHSQSAPDKGCPEPGTEGDFASYPDPRQPAYDAVYAYIRTLPSGHVEQNAMIWRAVTAALDATPVGRCISSHCVEGDHILDVTEEVADARTD